MEGDCDISHQMKENFPNTRYISYSWLYRYVLRMWRPIEFRADNSIWDEVSRYKA